jgi:hypothetical protein
MGRYFSVNGADAVTFPLAPLMLGKRDLEGLGGRCRLAHGQGYASQFRGRVAGGAAVAAPATSGASRMPARR